MFIVVEIEDVSFKSALLEQSSSVQRAAVVVKSMMSLELILKV